MVRMTYDRTGFTGYAKSCANGLTGPWGLPSAEVKIDAGATYFQSGARTLVWQSPRSGFLDLRSRRIFSFSGDYRSGYLAVYDLDTEEQMAVVPRSGTSQLLWTNSEFLLLLDLP
jgi:hypothetical protein